MPMGTRRWGEVMRNARSETAGAKSAAKVRVFSAGKGEPSQFSHLPVDRDDEFKNQAIRSRFLRQVCNWFNEMPV